jgi:hypothetical protein
MKKTLVSSFLSVLATAGMAVAQTPAPAKTAPGDTIVPLTMDATYDHPILTPHWPELNEPAGQCYGSLEYLLWWSKPGAVGTPLITTGSPFDTFPGSLGQPNTQVLFGPGNNFDYDAMSGIRFTVGYWFDRQGTVGIEGTGMIFERRETAASFSSNGSGAPLLSNPFINTVTARQDANDIAFPLAFAGVSGVQSTSQLVGGMANITFNMYRDQCWGLDGFAGFRYLGLAESVSVTDTTTSAPGGAVVYLGNLVPPPASTSMLDRFETFNHFYGGDFGGRYTYHHGSAYLEVTGNLGLGDVREVINVAGFSSLNVGPVNGVARTNGGLYAGPSNSGHYIQDTFAIVPEVDLKLGYQISCHVKANVGYTFLYWSDVARPGQQIDPNVNPNRVPTFIEFGNPGGGNSPQRQFYTTDYYAQGVTFGLEFSW